MQNPIIPIILVIVIIVAALLIRRNNNAVKADEHFDERQNMVRGKAYKVSSTTMVILGLLYYYAAFIFDLHIMEDGVSAFIIVCAGIAAYAVYAIFCDSFFGVKGKIAGLRSNPAYYIILLAIVVIINGVVSVKLIVQKEVIQNGVLTRNCINIVLTVTLLLILISIIIKYFIDRRESGDEE